MMEETPNSTESTDELQKLTAALSAAMSLLNGLSHESRQKLLQSLATIFSLHAPALSPLGPSQPTGPTADYDHPSLGGEQLHAAGRFHICDSWRRAGSTSDRIAGIAAKLGARGPTPFHLTNVPYVVHSIRG